MAGMQSKAAMHAMTKKAEGLLEPLIEGDERSVSSDESSHYSGSSASSISVEVKQTPSQKLKTGLVSLGLGVGVVASAAAMVLQPEVAVFVMGGVAIANVPYAVFKEYRIIKLPALRSLNNKLKEEANHLEDEVDCLEKEINDLEPEAARAAVVEGDLQAIAAEQHCNAEKFINLVKENEMIVADMRDNLRQRIVQDVLKIVMQSDKNNDGRFCKVETKMLVLKISLQLQEYGVEFDEGKFYKVMSADPSVQKTIEIVKRLIPDLNEEHDSEDEDEETTDMYDMFHMAGAGSFGVSVVSAGSSALEGPPKLSLSVSKQPKRESMLARQEGVRKEKEYSARKSDANRHGKQTSQSKRDTIKSWFRPDEREFHR
eukprot:CAMPEP_0172531640 /NCGR_PEP_ID=MMETSP1067-20121228/4961_1 /TAXON_ID=265564 ORGANISM="Thalassiosira punctigera, Strain Tpunct2005C2" /NCGR_SAMPLE_ID=MMETSP1067 /ASSEMBLY_ACC=CAM_ASM_000444 /LENGTH=371 /DNA_ID=CAMNT_0013316039 /DNA_START=157 /DNA_END=1272 /DNA_ORIENTATION=+